MTKQPDLRDISYEILFEVLERGQYSHVALAKALSKYQYFEKSDRSFIKRLVDGTQERLLTIDWILNTYSRVKVHKMKPAVRTVLRLSVYQLFWMDRVPDSAACNEAVKLIKGKGLHGLSGFVNGVLRSIARNKENVTFSEPSLRVSMPQWILELWSGVYGEEESVRIAGSFLEEPPLTARFYTAQASETNILESLAGEGVAAEPVSGLPSVFTLSGVDYVERLTAFQQGWIQIQDASSALVGLAAGFHPGDQVLDVCGAPGGKGIHAAQLLAGTGTVEIRDLSEAKIELVEDNIRRSGCANVTARAFDAREYDPAWEGKADVVLADLPCSGLGVIGRKPDIKYHMNPEKLRSLAALQREILSVVWRYVKPGGTLVYSTCTIDPMENEENRDWFLQEYPFEPMDIRGRLGGAFDGDTLSDGYIQLLPGTHPCDGFFIAVFRRKAET